VVSEIYEKTDIHRQIDRQTNIQTRWPQYFALVDVNWTVTVINQLRLPPKLLDDTTYSPRQCTVVVDRHKFSAVKRLSPKRLHLPGVKKSVSRNNWQRINEHLSEFSLHLLLIEKNFQLVPGPHNSPEFQGTATLSLLLDVTACNSQASCLSWLGSPKS